MAGDSVPDRGKSAVLTTLQTQVFPKMFPKSNFCMLVVCAGSLQAPQRSARAAPPSGRVTRCRAAEGMTPARQNPTIPAAAARDSRPGALPMARPFRVSAMRIWLPWTPSALSGSSPIDRCTLLFSRLELLDFTDWNDRQMMQSLEYQHGCLHLVHLFPVHSWLMVHVFEHRRLSRRQRGLFLFYT